MGSGCGSVGRVTASATIGLQFESGHLQNFMQDVFTRLPALPLP